MQRRSLLARQRRYAACRIDFSEMTLQVSTVLAGDVADQDVLNLFTQDARR